MVVVACGVKGGAIDSGFGAEPPPPPPPFGTFTFKISLTDLIPDATIVATFITLVIVAIGSGNTDGCLITSVAPRNVLIVACATANPLPTAVCFPTKSDN